MKLILQWHGPRLYSAFSFELGPEATLILAIAPCQSSRKLISTDIPIIESNHSKINHTEAIITMTWPMKLYSAFSFKLDQETAHILPIAPSEFHEIGIVRRIY